MALRSHWSRHDRCCWGRTGFQQLGGGAGRAGTCAVYRPLLADKASSLRAACFKPIEPTYALRKSQNVKPEDGMAAVAAESLSRLASVGLQYGFFIGCLDPVDDEIGTATMPRIRGVKRREPGEENQERRNLAGAPANQEAKRQIGPEPWIATTLDSFPRFDSTGFS